MAIHRVKPYITPLILCYSVSMASGKTHEWVTLAFLPPVWMVCRWVFQWSLGISVLVTTGTLIGGFWLSPDLDTRSRPFYRWGISRFIWWPYQWAFRHRSEWTHGILLASWLRLLYLSAVLALSYALASFVLSQYLGTHPLSPRQDILRFVHTHLKDILWLGIGIWFGSLLHILLDKLTSSLRTKRKRR